MAGKDELLNDLQEELEGANVPAATIEKVLGTFRSEIDSSSLRKKLEDEIAWRRETGEPAVQRVQHLDTVPARTAAVKEFGVDYPSSPQWLKDIIDGIPADKLEDGDHILEVFRAKGVEVTAPQPTPEELPKAHKVVQQGIAAPLGGSSAVNQIAPADFASWDMAKQRKFIQDHPEAYDALKRGEVVRGVTA